jgi:flavin-dependent dehydrogenase
MIPWSHRSLVDDVAIAGAGPAGSLAALILARAGLRVRLFDRARFPRHKLCGDTLNPGALAVLHRHLDVSPLVAQSDAIDGMILTGPRGVTVRASYGAGIAGRAITREVLDQWLAWRAVEAGVALEENVRVKAPAISDGRVAGLAVACGGASRTHPARIVIAADGRRSNLAIGRGLAHQPLRPRRWAIGAYFTGVTGVTRLGEMHVRQGHYIGVAPVPGGLTNACLVVPHAEGDAPFGSPAVLLRRYLDADAELRSRFATATAVGAPATIGPMAVEARAAGEPGLLLAGDAAGFIDPITGDGLHFALRGAELAASVALDVLSGRTPIDLAHRDLLRLRLAAFTAKWRFNRALRSLVSSPRGVSGAAVAATIMPALFERIIRYAGDCGTVNGEQASGNCRLPISDSRLPVPGSRFPVRR